MTPLEPNRDQIEIFVEGMLRYCGSDGIVSLRAFYEDKNENKPFRINNIKLAGGLPFLIEAAEDDARRAAQFPKPVVFCPPVATFAPTGRARQEDLLEAPALSVELDQHPRASLEGLERILGFATLVVRSGGEWTNQTTGEIEDKLHAHWRLKEPARGGDIAKLKRARQLATALVGGDPSNVPACHPIRWPGSWHRKATPRLCEIISTEHLDNELDLDVALADLEAVAPPTNGKGGPQQSAGQQGGQGALDWSDAFSKIISGEQFHPVLVPLASSFAARAVPEVAARGVLHALLDNTQTTDPERLKRRDVELKKLAATVRSGYEKFAPSGALFDPWQEFVAPPFPVDILPGVTHDFVVTKSADIGVDPSAMAMSTLATCSGAIHHRSRINLKRNGTWWVHPNLWVLLIGRSATKKSPGLDDAVRPLEQYQAEIMRDYFARLRDYQAKKKAKDKSAEEPPQPVRYVVNDTTYEKLADILSVSDRGILMKRDEIVGWIGSLDQYKTAGKLASVDRAFWLESWKGGPYTVDRVVRGSTFVPNLSTSMIGGIQPAKLGEIVGLTSDGLLQRFLPTLMQAAKRSGDIDCAKVTEQYKALVWELIALPHQQLRLTDGAIVAMAELQDHIFQLEQVGDAVAEGFDGFLGKLAGYAGSLTLILHVINNPQMAYRNFIGRTLVENVSRLVTEFLLPHALEFYRLGEGDSGRIKRIASYLLNCGLNHVRLTDLTSNIWDLRGKNVVHVNQRVSPLVAGGWLAPTEQGPACRAWTVNRAAIDTQFARRMQTEHDRKLALVQLFGERVRL
jgi:hypothetical protein